MKVAIVHYWLVGMRGGERVLEELVRLYPQADLFTHVADREKLSDLLANQKIVETFVSRLPWAKRHYQKYLGFMPRALEELDLSGYDLVISSESGPAKGVIVPPGTPHICYIHSPMRYIWDHYQLHKWQLGRLGRMYYSRLCHRLRIWDVTTAARVDHFVANSTFVGARVKRYYRRDASVVHPPVDLEQFGLPDADAERKAYLFVSQLVPYKRADLVIEAFRGLDQQLIVVGDGSQRAQLEKNLPANVTLLGSVPALDLRNLYQTSRALVFPAEEDFGIVPVEAMACGTPILAYGRGGALDSVVDGKTGLFFDAQTPEAIREVIQRFEDQTEMFDPSVIRAHAETFGGDRFRREFTEIVDGVLAAGAA